MFDVLVNLCVRIGDAVLGWTLSLPRDLTLLMVALVTAAIMVAVRPWATDQELLNRCADDKKRLRELIRQAKARKDKEAVSRHRLTKNMVGAKAMKQEGWPLVAAIVPILMVWVWGFERLDFHAPKSGEVIEVAAFFPVSAQSGGLGAHLVPGEGVSLVDGERSVKLISAENQEGVARWKIRAEASEQPRALSIAHEGKTYPLKLLVGQRTYLSPSQTFDERVTRVEVKLDSVKLLGLVPAIEMMAIPAWLMGYIILAIPLMFLLKKLVGIR
jgi:uncharacterized membrane protein (DUF106 family)